MTKKAEQIRTRLIYKVRDSAKAKGISQEKIAERSGRTQPTISGILKGDKNITLETFIDVCNASDIEIVLRDK